MKELYEMKLHDTLNVGDYTEVLRVPGGWIYQYNVPDHTGIFACTRQFVPFSDEFALGDNEYQLEPPPPFPSMKGE